MTWQSEAACLGADINIFYPEDDNYTRAAAICAVCPVKAECLQAAVDEEALRPGKIEQQVVGYRGGMSGRQRRKLIAEQHPNRKQELNDRFKTWRRWTRQGGEEKYAYATLRSYEDRLWAGYAPTVGPERHVQWAYMKDRLPPVSTEIDPFGGYCPNDRQPAA